MDEEKRVDVAMEEQKSVPELEGVLSEEEIDHIKAQYPDNDIYAVPIAGIMWVYRDIKTPEYHELRGAQVTTPEEFEALVVDRCVLSPTKYSFKEGKAGLVPVLCDLVFMASGFEPSAQPIKL